MAERPPRIPMANRFPFFKTCWLKAAIAALAMGILVITCGFTRPQNSPSSIASAKNGVAQGATARPLPRGKKLMLKDGSYQLIREYQVEGDRVRYYSLDSSQWEEIPANLVDWDKTKKVAADEAKEDAAEIAKVKSVEAQREAEMLTSMRACRLRQEYSCRRARDFSRLMARRF